MYALIYYCATSWKCKKMKHSIIVMQLCPAFTQLKRLLIPTPIIISKTPAALMSNSEHLTKTSKIERSIVFVRCFSYHNRLQGLWLMHAALHSVGNENTSCVINNSSCLWSMMVGPCNVKGYSCVAPVLVLPWQTGKSHLCTVLP